MAGSSTLQKDLIGTNRLVQGVRRAFGMADSRDFGEIVEALFANTDDSRRIRRVGSINSDGTMLVTVRLGPNPVRLFAVTRATSAPRCEAQITPARPCDAKTLRDMLSSRLGITGLDDTFKIFEISIA